LKKQNWHHPGCESESDFQALASNFPAAIHHLISTHWRRHLMPRSAKALAARFPTAGRSSISGRCRSKEY
jgi:hypothetical protein